MVRLWVVNTDNEWFDYLSGQPSIDEVNFWQPSGQNEFRAIEPGELFVFRLKSPRNAIGGFGIFQHASRLPVSLAWEAFGPKNGAPSLPEMRRRVVRLRDQPELNVDFTIGCRILTQPVFLPELAWIPLPESWAANTQVGRTFSTDDVEGRQLWDRIVATGSLLPQAEVFERPSSDPERRYGDPVLVKPRLGQGAFRIAVTDAYGRQCAVSGGRVLPALEAAHIKPYGEGGTHDVSNGLLVRRDIHSVFDAGYVTVDSDLKFVVSDRVRTDFNNGHEYRRLHGSTLVVPSNPALRPSVEALAWHNENCFLG
jgi:putative restriction endonuclease